MEKLLPITCQHPVDYQNNNQSCLAASTMASEFIDELSCTQKNANLTNLDVVKLEDWNMDLIYLPR